MQPENSRPVRARSLRVYRALLDHAREHGLPYHAVGVDLGRLAERLGYLVKGAPDKARVLGDVRAAEDDQVLVRLDCGRRRDTDQGGLCALYCLRSATETLEAAVEHGQLQREYLKRRQPDVAELLERPEPAAPPREERVRLVRVPAAPSTDHVPRPHLRVDLVLEYRKEHGHDPQRAPNL